MLRDLAMAWVRASCTDRRVQRDFVRHLNLAMKQGINCSFTIGHELTKAGKPYSVHCFAGELFVFELTPRQARSLRVAQNMLQCVPGSLQKEDEEGFRPVVSLDQLEIDHAAALDLKGRISGRCSYRSVFDHLVPYAVRLDYDLPGRCHVASWHYPNEPLAREGGLSFSFPPGQERTGPAAAAFSGTIALFARLCTVPDHHTPQARQPLSNVCAVLVNVR